MSAPSDARWRLRGSPRLAVVVVLVHAAGACGLLLVVPGAAGGLLAGLTLALGLAAARDRALLLGRRSMHALSVGEDLHVELTLGDGRQTGGRANARRHVCRLWVAMALGAPARRALLVTADMMEPAAFRRLRLWALWGDAALGRSVKGVA